MQRLKVFGGVSIETEGGPLSGRAVQRRRLALLTLLAAARSRGVSRDRLITYLWPTADAENGRRFLSDSVYRINQALGGDVILVAGDELRLDSQRLPSDLGEFEEALSRRAFDDAVRLYAGAFLDGFFLSDAPEFERWIEGERDRLAREYGRALEALALSAESEADRAAAVGWWRRLAAHDPYNSRVALRLMQSLVAAGERAAAIQHARVHETLLTEELEVEPDEAVRAFAERLRHDPTAGSVAAPKSLVVTAPTPASVGSTATAATAPSLAVSSPLDASHEGRAPTGEAVPPRRRFPLSTRVGVGVLVVILLALVGSLVVRGRTGTASPTRTLAVLPFANVSADREGEYFADGITEELITTLAQVRGLRVASRTSSFTFKNRSVDVREIGRQLGVAAVVEGSVRRSGPKLSITAQLVSTETGYALWSSAYDRELDDVFAIQEEISRAVIARLVGTREAGDQVTVAERSTRDPETYDLYLKGRFAWHRRTREGLRQAIDYFDRAIAREPDYARAYAGLADAYAVSAFYDYLQPRDAYPKAEAAAQRAMDLEPTLTASRATLGYVLTYYHMDWKRAEDEFERTLEADPAYSTAHQWYGNLLTVAGRFADAERAFRAAQEADPLSLIAQAALGWSFYYAGRFDDAVEQCRRTLALNPNFELAHMWGAWALAELGRDREAREWIERAVRLSDASPLTRLELARQLAHSSSPSDQQAARATVREMEARRTSGEYVPSYEIAKVHLALGDRQTAQKWLEQAAEERSHSRAFFRVDPQLARLRGDPAFEALVRRTMRVDR